MLRRSSAPSGAGIFGAWHPRRNGEAPAKGTDDRYRTLDAGPTGAPRPIGGSSAPVSRTPTRMATIKDSRKKDGMQSFTAAIRKKKGGTVIVA